MVGKATYFIMFFKQLLFVGAAYPSYHAHPIHHVFYVKHERSKLMRTTLQSLCIRKSFSYEALFPIELALIAVKG